MISGTSAAAGVLAAVSTIGRGESAGLKARSSQPPGENRPSQPEGAAAPRRVAPASSASKPKGSDDKLNEEQKRQVSELKRRDTEVRAHENAHSTAGGNYTSAPSFEFTTGPDGKRYATSGEVQIDSSPVRGNPRATMRKMDVVIRAATAPADPSPQDMAVARKAQAERANASNELMKSPETAGAGSPAAPASVAAPEPPAAAEPPAAPSASQLLQAQAAYGGQSASGGADGLAPQDAAPSASQLLQARAAYGDQPQNQRAARLALELASLATLA